MTNGTKTATAQVKNGTLILPRAMRSAWQQGKVFVFPSADTLIIKKLQKPVRKLSAAAAQITLPPLTTRQIQNEITAYRRGA